MPLTSLKQYTLQGKLRVASMRTPSSLCLTHSRDPRCQLGGDSRNTHACCRCVPGSKEWLLRQSTAAMRRHCCLEVRQQMASGSLAM